MLQAGTVDRPDELELGRPLIAVTFLRKGALLSSRGRRWREGQRPRRRGTGVVGISFTVHP
jgi:hypothetical protein